MDRNYFGQLGLGDTECRNKPVEFKIKGNSSPIKQIICEEDYTFAICENNKIYCWEYNHFGQLGLGDAIDRNIPVEFKIKGNSSGIKQIIRASHTFAICENNKIYCSGRNNYGQYGLGDDGNNCNPLEFKIDGN